MSEVQSQPGSGSEAGGTFGDAKGILQSLSHGVRQLVVLEEKLTSLSKEDDRFRKSIEDLQAIVQRTAGTLTELDKRFAERFAELDKRLDETDRRVQVQIELAVHKVLGKPNDPSLAKDRRSFWRRWLG
jgi:hypothetical protein